MPAAIKLAIAAVLVLASADAQKCLQNIDMVVDAGLCEGYEIKAQGACWSDPTATAGKVASQTKLFFSVYDKATCEEYFNTLCSSVQGTSRTGNCDRGANSRGCARYFELLITDLERGACTADSECSANSVPDASISKVYKKGAQKICCRAIKKQYTDVCAAVNDKLLDTEIERVHKAPGTCLDEDCFGSASPLAVSLWLPWAAAMVALFIAKP